MYFSRTFTFLIIQAKKRIATKIKALFPSFTVKEFTDQKERMHILVSNPRNGKKLRIRVSESKNYAAQPNKFDETMRPHLEYAGWWTFQPSEIENTPADMWILIQPESASPIRSLLFSFTELTHLLSVACTKRADGQKDFYWYIPNIGSNFAARPLGTKGIRNVLEGVSTLDPTLNLDGYVDTWEDQIGGLLS